jgi:small subunit ribosomal protein S4
LREKEKARSFYGVLERQFRRYFAMAQKSGQAPGEKLLIFLERRLDNTLVVTGLLPSRRSARQLIGSGHIRVNGRRMSIPSYLVDNGDEVDFRSGSRVLPRLKEMILAGGVVKQCPAWLNLDKEAVKIKVLREPSRSEVSVLVEEGHIVNLYSR